MAPFAPVLRYKKTVECGWYMRLRSSVSLCLCVLVSVCVCVYGRMFGLLIVESAAAVSMVMIAEGEQRRQHDDEGRVAQAQLAPVLHRRRILS